MGCRAEERRPRRCPSVRASPRASSEPSTASARAAGDGAAPAAGAPAHTVHATANTTAATCGHLVIPLSSSSSVQRRLPGSARRSQAHLGAFSRLELAPTTATVDGGSRERKRFTCRSASGYPMRVRGVDRRGIVDWARRAEQAGFSSLGTLDRIAYPNYESLITLAAAAAVTERIRLVTDILIAPLRTNTRAVRQAGGDDRQRCPAGAWCSASPSAGAPTTTSSPDVDFHTRGAHLRRQLGELTELWAGDAVGPAPANGKRPSLLIGGRPDRRVPSARRGTPTAGPWAAARRRQLAGGGQARAGRGARPGREGKPRTMALMYFVARRRRRADGAAESRQLLRVPRRTTPQQVVSRPPRTPTRSRAVPGRLRAGRQPTR